MQYDLSLTEAEETEINSALRPTRFRILVAMPKVQQKIGSVYVPDARRSDEETASVIVRVMALGPDAFADPVDFPTGSPCSVGDSVLIAPYAGHRLKVSDREVRIINDTSVLALVTDADKVSRAYDR